MNCTICNTELQRAGRQEDYGAILGVVCLDNDPCIQELHKSLVDDLGDDKVSENNEGIVVVDTGVYLKSSRVAEPSLAATDEPALSLTQKLATVQSKLHAPKTQHNTFGNYFYRSCEDILQAVKPLLGDCIITISDDIVAEHDRVYVKATATFTDGMECIEVTAYAREPKERRGMDDAQLTGATSSYARKYALNGLLLIDDNKDADSDEVYSGQPTGKKPTGKKPTDLKALLAECEGVGKLEGAINWIRTQTNDPSITQDNATEKIQDKKVLSGIIGGIQKVVNTAKANAAQTAVAAPKEVPAPQPQE